MTALLVDLGQLVWADAVSDRETDADRLRIGSRTRDIVDVGFLRADRK